MMVVMNFQDIPRFTRNPSYRPTVDWKFLPFQLERWMGERGGCKLDMNPEFQRAHVWTEAQQRAYVEYALKGGSSGREIYFNCVGWQNSFKGPFVLVDGKQRLEAVLKFLRNELAVFDGNYFKDFTGHLPTTAAFNFNVNDLPTMKEVLTWYLEMNTGGTPHTKEEIDKVKTMLTKTVA